MKLLMASLMTFRKLILAFTVTLAINSCKTSTKLTFRVAQFDTTIKPIKLPISELAENYKKYQGQYIETTGNFFQAFEQFAIYPDKNILAKEVRGFWLDTNKDLNIDYSSFDKMNRKRITIKGLVDTTDKGHLSSYLATISKIYFWEQQ